MKSYYYIIYYSDSSCIHKTLRETENFDIIKTKDKIIKQGQEIELIIVNTTYCSSRPQIGEIIENCVESPIKFYKNIKESDIFLYLL